MSRAPSSPDSELSEQRAGHDDRKWTGGRSSVNRVYLLPNVNRSQHWEAGELSSESWMDDNGTRTQIPTDIDDVGSNMAAGGIERMGRD
mmetsp:Transcript_33400/g.79886  ORF Transcript_33400/g.79886 Transcript_33400/m.79886 type:complete len:89 (+) Transcript_33400:389-655(+)